MKNRIIHIALGILLSQCLRIFSLILHFNRTKTFLVIALIAREHGVIAGGDPHPTIPMCKSLMDGSMDMDVAASCSYDCQYDSMEKYSFDSNEVQCCCIWY